MRTRVAAGAVLALLAAGCASDGADEDPAPSASATGSGQDPETPADTPSETPTGTPTVKPVTGPEMEVQGISIRLPEGWRVGYDTPIVSTAQGPLGIVVLSAIAGEPWSLDRLYQDDLRSDGDMQTLQRHADTALDGLPAFHYGGRVNRHMLRDGYGTWDSGYHVTVRFDLLDFRARAKRRELVESVVATYDSPSS